MQINMNEEYIAIHRVIRQNSKDFPRYRNFRLDGIWNLHNTRLDKDRESRRPTERPKTPTPWRHGSTYLAGLLLAFT
jgi:hypothetical protein